ncbi:hypothetical protein [Leptolyngbya sp. PCC 6406]|uniref:hypothetical protein n=1 Tax=Leptolyngbya sp. PCC 6406 TaxID=1173264 RepID=UPI0002ACEF4D|nr:hypothetical protein [Leptolyngbya sp. PCC 6406]
MTIIRGLALTLVTATAISSLTVVFTTEIVSAQNTTGSTHNTGSSSTGSSASIDDLLNPTDGASLVTDSVTDFSNTQNYKRWFYLFGGQEEPIEIVPALGGQWNAPDGSILTATGGTLKADSPTSLVRRWVSNITGEIILSNILTADAFADIRQQIVWNSQEQGSQEIISINGMNGTGETGTQQSLYVQAGDSIDIIVSSLNSEVDITFGNWNRIESMSVGGLSYIDSKEGVLQIPIILDCENVIMPYQFNGIAASLIGANTRSLPGIIGIDEQGNYIGRGQQIKAGASAIPNGTPLAFDSWTRCGINIQYTGLNIPATNAWYRIAGTASEWISGSIVNNVLALPVPTTPLGYGVQHIGIRLEDVIQEAYRAYTEKLYWDPERGTDVEVPNRGDVVIADHSPGSFVHRSPTIANSPVMEAKYAAISGQDADAMNDYIKQLLGEPYLDNAPCPRVNTFAELLDILNQCFITPAEEKGYEGEKYTAAGLLERAAEEVGAGYGRYRGFIPNKFEVGDTSIENLIKQGNYNAESLEIRQVIDPDGNVFSVNPTTVSVITPWLLFGYASGEIIPSAQWIQGILESVSGFVLVDPNKNTLGYLSSTLDLSDLQNNPELQLEFQLFDSLPRNSLFQNIAGASLNKTDYVTDSTKGIPIYGPNCPEPDPVESVFQFHVPNRIENQGGYSLWIFGKNRNSKVVVGSENGAKLIYPGCDGYVVVDPVNIPEPSLGLGLFASLLGLGLIGKKKYLSQD